MSPVVRRRMNTPLEKRITLVKRRKRFPLRSQ